MGGWGFVECFQFNQKQGYELMPVIMPCIHVTVCLLVLGKIKIVGTILHIDKLFVYVVLPHIGESHNVFLEQYPHAEPVVP